jgi:hypothetical protein
MNARIVCCAAAAVLAVTAMIATATPARADRDGWRWHRHDRGGQEWRGHEWRERLWRPRPYVYVPPPIYYYVPPRGYYGYGW